MRKFLASSNCTHSIIYFHFIFMQLVLVDSIPGYDSINKMTKDKL